MRDRSRVVGRPGAVLRASVLVAAASSILFAHPGHDVGGGDPGASWGGDFPSENMEFLGQVTLADLGPGGRTGSDCWGYVSPSGREYALLGVSDGFGFIEVTDPILPQIVAFIPGAESSWRDIKTYGSYAYGVSEASIGIHVFDLSDIDNGNVTFVRAVTTGGLQATHNVAINEDTGYLYRIAGGSGTNIGLRIYDLNGDPSNPSFVASHNQFYIHDAQIVSYDSGPFAGREIAFCCSGFNGGGQDTRLRIVDVTDKGNIFNVASATYPGRSYAHQGWLSEDKQCFYLNDELDENTGATPETTTHVFDVSDINTPTWANSFSTGLGAIDHNLYVHNGMIFESNYTSGLRVFDATDPINPVEVAWIDTYPSSDSPSFNGIWSNYPWLPSGNILISDISQGLVVVRLIIDRIEFSFHQGLPDPFDPDGCTKVHVEMVDVGLQHDLSTLRLFVEDSGGVTEHLPEILPTPGHYNFFVGALPCGETARYWLECDTVGGVRFRAPSRGGVDPFLTFISTHSGPTLSDDFDADLGWSVSSAAVSGAWERGVPVANGASDPPTDFDGSGSCYITGNAPGDVGVDDGDTTLISPPISFSPLGGVLTYAYWFNGTSPASGDFLRVSLSTDGGQSWSEIRAYNDFQPEWRTEEIRFGPDGEFPGADEILLRFVAVDRVFNQSDNNEVEAAVDAIDVEAVSCSPVCAGDLNGDGVTDVLDFSLFAAGFGGVVSTCSGSDFDGDGMISVFDFTIFTNDFGCVQ